ncbi:putative MT-associated protein TORTIFOLIA1/SPIRAL2 [Lupinus albus]|uniref:Putative MT-associated protein TORTIFOLIA1/SPIRAL2 n=1 Tax=Lupinus albus TaxID=3870 RepID=A0A6A4P933_LUPAL|nr:putative MT-associated protein TORTIFOLIA1/SPIRAL2 [Lupinus albus]
MKKSHSQGKANFELKHKVVVALNKLGDRDTQQIGIDELHKTAQCLTPEAIPSFLSCLLDTDSNQKSGIRKECVRLMATLATFHHIGPYLPKMVAAIVKRLRDPDSMVRDVCVQTTAVLASKLNDDDNAFLVLVRPFFEALGEQNKHIQSTSALCLSAVIDNTHRPSLHILHKILTTRVLKLLNNPHFMAKPALLHLTRAILLGGGAPTENILCNAVAAIQQALKHSDWTTRKAASVALADIALSGASSFASLKASCIHSLESCRFDKVKPVRDAVLQALKYWKILPAPHTPEPSEAGSSLKENLCRGDSADISSTTDSGHRDDKHQKVNTKSNTGRIPLSARKVCQNYVGNPHYLKQDDWHVEIAVPGTHSSVEFQNEESESNSVTKPLETISVDVTSMQDVGCEYVPIDEKQESSSVSNLATDNFETKFLSASHDCFIDSGVQKPYARRYQCNSEEISCNEQMYSIRTQHPGCSDSTIIDSSPQTSHKCCAQMANEISCVQNQLSDIEIKQTNMMHQLQMFTTGIMDALSTIQSRIVSLENVLNIFTEEPILGGRNSFSENSKFVRQSQNVASPRFSICTPRPSLDTDNKQTGYLPVKSSETFENKTYSRIQPMNSARVSVDMWKSCKVTTNAKFFKEQDNLNSSGKNTRSMGSAQMRKNDGNFSSATSANGINGCSYESNTNYWNRVKRLVCEGDLNTAYMEALRCRDERILVELLNKTGPVIESLSVKTVNVLFNTLASYLLEGRFFDTIIPWLQQVVEMSTIYGPKCIALSIGSKENILSAVQEVVNLNIFSHAERSSAADLVMKLNQVWGKITGS